MSDPGTDAMEGKPAKRGTSDSGFGSTFEDCGCPPHTKQPAGVERRPVNLIAQAASKLQEDDVEIIRHEIREGRLSLLAARGGRCLAPPGSS